MIPFIRRIFIISLLFAIIIFIQSIQVEASSVINPKNLIVLGFAILASFTLGEILALIKLPRVIGYLLVGIFFGPYSNIILQTDFLQVINFRTLSDLSLVNTITLSVIALTAGMELKISTLKDSVKPISLILLFKLIFVFIIVTGATFALSSFIPFMVNANWQIILASGLLLSVIALGTSIELTLVVTNESKVKNKFSEIILSTAIVKDVLVILALAVCLTIASVLIEPTAKFGLAIFYDLGLELLLSVIAGIIFGGLVILYIKYINRELLLFIITFVVIAGEISRFLHLETLIVFVAAGFIIQNFSKFGEQFHHPLEKISLPIFIIFFTVAGASINISSLKAAFLLGLIFAVVRIAAYFFSVRLGAKVSKMEETFQNYGWMGFLSIGGLMLGLAILIQEKLPTLGGDLKNLITAVVAINLFLGPILLKIALGFAKSAEARNELPEEKPDEESIKALKEKNIDTKFKEPQFEDKGLNKSLFQILFDINDILKNFDQKFVQQHSEESLELVISVIEKYTDDYNQMRNLVLDGEFDPTDAQKEILKIKKELAEWNIDFAQQRKQIEKNILKLEPLVKDLFIALTDLTDGLEQSFVVRLEKSKVKIDEDDSIKDKLFKSIYKARLFIGKIFSKDFHLHRKINYKNLAKYYLVGQSADEILETVNLVGAERLNTLRRIRKLYSDYSKYLDELLLLINNEKHEDELKEKILNKFDELHSLFVSELAIYQKDINQTTDELSTRLHYALANPYNKFIDVLGLAGTYKFKESKLKYSKIFTESEENKEKSLETVRYWVNYYIGFLGIFQEEAHIIKLEVQINQAVNSSLIEISEEISENINEAIVKIKENTAVFSDEVEQNKNLDDEAYSQFLESSSEKHFLTIIQNSIKSLEDLKQSKELRQLIENLMHDFIKFSYELPQKLELLEDSDFKLKDRSPEFIELKQVSIRGIVRAFLENNLPREIGEINELLLNHLNLTLIELNNILSIVNFHISTAQNELKKQSTLSRSSAEELLTSLFEKLGYRTKYLTEQAESLETNINTRIINKVAENTKEINRIVLNSSVLKKSLYLGKEEKKQAVTSFVSKNIGRIRHTFKKARILAKRNYRKYFKKYIDGVLISLSLKEKEEKDSYSEISMLNEEKLKKLPFIYRKLFDGTPLETTDFLIKNKELQSLLQKAYDNFNNGKISSTVLIGEPGSGKQTIVNSIKNEFLADTNILHYRFQETITSSGKLISVLSHLLGYDYNIRLDELIISLNDKSNKRIIIFENIGKLFFRQIKGYDALETFAYILSQTSKNTLWLCTIGKHTWEFLCSGFELHRLFYSKIFLSNLQKNKLHDIIISRHNATGFELKYLPGEMRELRSKFFKTESIKIEQQELEKNFFNKLEEYSEGNIISAMFYWLHSIHDVKDNQIIINAPHRPSLDVINKLDDIYMLTLSEILIHSWLSVAEHKKLFNLSETDSRKILGYLESINLLRKDSIDIDSDKYFINEFIFKVVEQELIKRNMI